MTTSGETLRKGTRGAGPKDEKAVVRGLSLTGIAGNAALSAFKLFAGVAGRSSAMISDAAHSLSDVLATLIALVGVLLSKRAADDDHPYGHERFESVATLLLGLILLATGGLIGKAGLEDLLSGNDARRDGPGLIALVAAVVSIAVKEAMYWYTRRCALRLDSAAFMADAWHHRSDALSSVGSLIGIAGARMGYPALDPAAGVVICLVILTVALRTTRDALGQLLDTSCGRSYDRELADFIAAQEGVVRVDLLRTRRFGNRVYVDLEISVDGDESLRKAHSVAERVHLSVEQRFPGVKHIMIHVNPAA